MSARVIRCDQAIFTSIRTPTGEGYRIISASKGVRTEERQVITRLSPSHDSICDTQTIDPSALIRGMACYPLSTQRLCIAWTGLAGAEHTGRGGQRVYTHNLIVDDGGFQKCGFNPFSLLRGLSETGLIEMRLKPPRILEPLEIEVTEEALRVAGPSASVLTSSWRRFTLASLLRQQSLIVNLPGDWLVEAETLLMGIPGPLRMRTSFAAGLKYSVARSHQLSLLCDAHGTAKTRSTGQQVTYIDPIGDSAPPQDQATAPEVESSPAWLDFVDRHLDQGDCDTLSRRTSRPYADTGPPGRQRAGRLFNEIDSIPSRKTESLLPLVESWLDEPTCSVEADLAAQLVREVQRIFLERIPRHSWVELEACWSQLGRIWRHSNNGQLFAEAVFDLMLGSAARDHPTTAARAVLDLVREVPAGADSNAMNSRMDGVLVRLESWAKQASDQELAELPALCKKWRTARGDSEGLERVESYCAASSSNSNQT